MKLLYILLALTLTGCATTQELIDARQEKMMACIKEYKNEGANLVTAYEVCRRVYGSNRVQHTRINRERRE